jgi:hypothetical protein
MLFLYGSGENSALAGIMMRLQHINSIVSKEDNDWDDDTY